MIQDSIRSGFAGAPVVTAMEVIPVAGRDGVDAPAWYREIGRAHV